MANPLEALGKFVDRVAHRTSVMPTSSSPENPYNDPRAVNWGDRGAKLMAIGGAATLVVGIVDFILSSN